ncbi:MAG: hypothetical protein VR64_04330 [Desulfatitalea sp. BRH_c12]|nr:MAG: hypothetical protein VR64_04330 [Desulfatitalea sp. BRH_c12]
MRKSSLTGSMQTVLKKAALFFLSISLMATAMGPHSLAWCLHADSSGANHLIAEKTILNISHGCDDHHNTQATDPMPSCDIHSGPAVHLPFLSQPAAIQENERIAHDPGLVSYLSLHAMPCLSNDDSRQRLFSDGFAAAALLPDASLAALRTVILQN